MHTNRLTTYNPMLPFYIGTCYFLAKNSSLKKKKMGLKEIVLHEASLHCVYCYLSRVCSGSQYVVSDLDTDIAVTLNYSSFFPGSIYTWLLGLSGKVWRCKMRRLKAPEAISCNRWNVQIHTSSKSSRA